MKVLAATYFAMLFVDTIGAIDPFGKDRGKVPSFLPAPRVYLATFLLWGLLGIVAGVGPSAARLAGRLSAVVLLTAAVIGPFGKKAVTFLEAAAHAFPATQESH